MTTRVMVIGRQGGKPPFGLPESRTGAEYVMAESMADVRDHLADCDVVFHYGRPRDALSANWALTGRLRWVHVGGVGVDWTLFPDLVESDVMLTNSRGVFDTTLARVRPGADAGAGEGPAGNDSGSGAAPVAASDAGAAWECAGRHRGGRFDRPCRRAAAAQHGRVGHAGRPS